MSSMAFTTFTCSTQAPDPTLLVATPSPKTVSPSLEVPALSKLILDPSLKISLAILFPDSIGADPDWVPCAFTEASPGATSFPGDSCVGIISNST
ncbi:hypothetical protein D3C72_1366050 [compost metagenome]